MDAGRLHHPPDRPRALRLAAGAGLTVAGLAMLVLPGPGLLTLLGAAHLLADDIPGLRSLLGRLPRPLRPRDRDPAVLPDQQAA